MPTVVAPRRKKDILIEELMTDEQCRISRWQDKLREESGQTSLRHIIFGSHCHVLGAPRRSKLGPGLYAIPPLLMLLLLLLDFSEHCPLLLLLLLLLDFSEHCPLLLLLLLLASPKLCSAR